MRELKKKENATTTVCRRKYKGPKTYRRFGIFSSTNNDFFGPKKTLFVVENNIEPRMYSALGKFLPTHNVFLFLTHSYSCL